MCYRGRPCCGPCRALYESGTVRKPPRLTAGNRPSRNGPSDRQRGPAELDPAWDDVIRAAEDRYS